MVQIAIEEISRQLRGAYIAPNNPQIKFVGDVERMDFVYATAPSDRRQPVGYDLRRVSYSLILIEEEESKVKKLMREESMMPYAFEFPSVASEGNIDAVEPPSISSEEVIDSVSRLRFRYFGQDGWQESWDSNRDLPQTVQISLVLQDEKGSKETFSTMVDVPGGG